ncbi:MAG: DUF3301 domain-containing protein [Gammaproteobacteria bacterium]|nr:DUF3301 domain-containing protein [Gammaproteobacteria bacterium]
MQQLFILFFLFLVTAYWIDSVKVKELARKAGALACKKHDVQFLDNTVVKCKTGLRKHHANLVTIERQYTFDFSTDGEQRESGIIIMAGHHLIEVHMDFHTYDNQNSA